MSKEVHPMYRPLKTARKSKGKGAAMPQDEVLTTERDTYFAKVAQDQAENDAKVALQLKEDEELARGDTYECGCCFDDILLSKMVACSEAHLFCVDCARKNAEHTLGNRGSVSSCLSRLSLRPDDTTVCNRKSRAWIRTDALLHSLTKFFRPSSRLPKCFCWRRSDQKRQ